MSILIIILLLSGMLMYGSVENAGGLNAYYNRVFFTADKWAYAFLPIFIFVKKITEKSLFDSLLVPVMGMVLFGILTGVKVKDISLAMILPLIGVAVITCAYGKMREIPECVDGLKRLIRERTFIAGLPLLAYALMCTGIFMPVYIALLILIYALLVEFLIYRELKIGELPEVVMNSAADFGEIFLVLILSVALHQWMNYRNVPHELVLNLAKVFSTGSSLMVFLSILMVGLGYILEFIPAVIFLAPVLTSVAINYGVNPIHFGTVMMVSLIIGSLKAKKKDHWILTAALFGFVLVMIFVPQVSMYFVDR